MQRGKEQIKELEFDLQKFKSKLEKVMRRVIELKRLRETVLSDDLKALKNDVEAKRAWERSCGSDDPEFESSSEE